MERRHFIRLAVTAAAGFAFDPDRALYVPGAKMISIPKPSPVRVIQAGSGMYRLVVSRTGSGDYRWHWEVVSEDAWKQLTLRKTTLDFIVSEPPVPSGVVPHFEFTGNDPFSMLDEYTKDR